jgi:hypothetical protein
MRLLGAIFGSVFIQGVSHAGVINAITSGDWGGNGQVPRPACHICDLRTATLMYKTSRDVADEVVIAYLRYTRGLAVVARSKRTQARLEALLEQSPARVLRGSKVVQAELENEQQRERDECLDVVAYREQLVELAGEGPVDRIDLDATRELAGLRD